jgi:predicted SAM-dependent methyltransferase
MKRRASRAQNRRTMTMSQDAPLRYDLGGYKSAANKRITVNLFGNSDLHHDIRELDAFIPEDAVVDEFYLSHTLEHIPVVDYSKFLCDLYRKLRIFGRVIVIQTDAGEVLRAWSSGQLSFRAMRATLFPPAAQIRKTALHMHHNMWSAEELAKDFRAVGFIAETFDAGAWPYDQPDELLPDETRPYFGFPIRNLGVLATKMEWREGDR